MELSRKGSRCKRRVCSSNRPAAVTARPRCLPGGGDECHVIGQCGNGDAQRDPGRALAEATVRGIEECTKYEAGDQSEDDARRVHRAQDGLALVDAECIEPCQEQDRRDNVAGGHESDIEEYKVDSESGKTYLADWSAGILRQLIAADLPGVRSE